MEELATEEEISTLINLYHEYFSVDDNEEDEQPIPDVSASKQQLNDLGGDFGMEVEGQMPPDALAFALGFKSRHLPRLFNTFRHRDGISPWDQVELFRDRNFDSLPDFLTSSFLHWHQLAGVHSIARNTFTTSPRSKDSVGMLIGDEVGLGKTAQAIAFIAFLCQNIWLQDNKLPPPKILGAVIPITNFPN